MSDAVIKMDKAALLAVCTSSLWAGLVAERSPFVTSSELHRAVDEAFDELSEDDWLEAFSGHPRVGDVDDLRARFAGSGEHSEREQAGLSGTDEAVLEELASGNERYEQRFGFVFLVRAAGRTAAQILELQRDRLANDRAAEITNAAQQQREITHLRLEQAVGSQDPTRPLVGGGGGH